MAFAVDVPLNEGVVSDVISSLDDVPVSLAVSRSGFEGAAGTVLSDVTVRGVETGLGPSAFVAVAVIRFVALFGIATMVVTE